MAPTVPGQEVEAIKGQSNCTMTLKTPKNQGFRSTPLFLVQKKCNLNSGVVHPRALYLFFTFSLPNSVFAGGPAGFWRGRARNRHRAPRRPHRFPQANRDSNQSPVSPLPPADQWGREPPDVQMERL
jgi:hypothetical protein